MAIIPSEQKFHTVPAGVQTVERGSSLANSQREIYTMQDIVDSVGGGGLHTLVKPKSGQFMSAMLANGGYGSLVSNVANKIMLVPYVPAQDISYTSLSVNVVIGDVGTPFARILVYSDSNGVPSSKLYESANIPTGFSGYQSVSTSGTFVKGTTYWIGMYTDSNGTFFDGYPSGSLYTLTYLGETASSIQVTATFGSAPSTITSGSINYVNTTIPITLIQ